MENYLVFCALFHLLAFASDFYVLYLYRTGPSAPGAGSFGGFNKYLTHLNHKFQTWYCLLAFAVTVLEIFKSARPRSNSAGDSRKGTRADARPSWVPRLVVDRIFALLCGLSTVVGLLFWTMFFYDRELILPASMDKIYPPEMNVYQHGVVAVIMWLELLLVRHYASPSAREDAYICIAFSSGYISWSYVVYFQMGKWAYPFMNLMSHTNLILFFFVSQMISLGVALAMRKATIARWGVVDSAKAKAA